MGGLKHAFRNILLPLFFVYFFLHIGFTTWRLFQVDSTRIGYENLKDGPLLLKPGKHIKNRGNVIEAIGYGKLSALTKKKKKSNSGRTLTENKDVGIPRISKIVEKVIVSEARKILAKTDNSTNFIYFAMINKAYERMTLNWICNTATMENVHNRTLIISLDTATCNSIRSQWDETIKCVSLNLKSYQLAYDWGRQQYINLLTLRANLMYLLTSSDVPFVLFETDAVWFEDPKDLFANRTLGFEDFDIIVPVKGFDGGKWDTLAFDPMFVQNTDGAKMFVKEMSERLNNDTTLYDQDVMNQLCASQHNGLICRQFDYKEVADGKWFKMEEKTRSKPIILFNSGTKNKETRLALNGFWFLASKTNQCVISKVTSFLEHN